MRLANGIRQFGFRKWYERELTQSHVHLFLLLLCAIGLTDRLLRVAGTMERLQIRPRNRMFVTAW